MTAARSGTLVIDYEAKGFPSASDVNTSSGKLLVTWNELLWSALTVGRPNLAYVFVHGGSSVYEAIFRLSLIRMALEQSGPTARRLKRTPAAKRLDPSEKGAVNYFVGLTMAKLFAARLLNAPWSLHVDVFGQSIGTMLSQRSRPDLLAQIQGSDEWVSIEAKGRISKPDATAKSRAKEQARRIAIRGAVVRNHVGCIAFLRNDVIEVYLEDPEPRDKAYQAELDDDQAWSFYYQPALSLAIADNQSQEAVSGMQKNIDVFVHVHPEVIVLLRDKKWREAKAKCSEIKEQLKADGYQPDGLKVEAGASWRKKFLASSD